MMLDTERRIDRNNFFLTNYEACCDWYPFNGPFCPFSCVSSSYLPAFVICTCDKTSLDRHLEELEYRHIPCKTKKKNIIFQQFFPQFNCSMRSYQ